MQAESTVKDAPGWETAFAERHRLSPGYLEHAQKWFAPLAARIAVHHDGANRALLVGINGSQGSGKTTVCDYLRENLAACHGKRAVCLSLDDFYQTRHQRLRLARDVHPLLATRGVPGTHDMTLLGATLDGLLAGNGDEPVCVPRFDKARDDRKPADDWDRVEPPVEVVLLEGWCLGVRTEPETSLAVPVNELERAEDSDGAWRRYVNGRIGSEFEPLYRRIDRWAMLCAPSFDCVYRWRREQERKLALAAGGDGGRIMDDEQLLRFVQFYERITRRCLQGLPARVHHLYQLDESREITREIHREIPKP